MKPSEEVRKLNGKEGDLIDLVKQYLDIKKANYSILEEGPNHSSPRPEGVEPAVEPGSIMIEKKGKKVIIEQLTKVCGLSGRYHDTDKKVRVHSIIDRSPSILFKTYKDEKTLHINTRTEIKEPTFGIYLGGANLTVHMEDILREPSKTPDYDETFEVRCQCENGKLKCKGHTWEW
jgi:hypothetical protein